MRLTNVAHLRLPFGRLMGYDVRVSEPGRPLPISFDQRRHVEEGERPGSWMAISFHLGELVPREQLAQAWLAVIQRHGTLRSVFVAGDEGPQLREIEVAPGSWVEHPVGQGQAVNDALHDVLDRTCTPYSAPSHRLCVLETADGPTVVIAADHAHVDMWSMLVIVRDLLTALPDPHDGRPLSPAPPFAVHTAALRGWSTAPEEVHRRWREIIEGSGGVMPRFPLPLGPQVASRERVEVRDVLDVDDSAAFSAQARSDGVSTLALAVSAMTEVTRELADAPLRVVFPVHSRHETYWHDSVGWFITNSVLESTDPDPASCAAAVKEAIGLGSWPLEDILEPWGGMPDAPGMFAISWLDLRRLPVRVDAAGLEAKYIGASIRTDGVMLWFILDENGLHLRCRYPDTEEARANVGAWLDLLVSRLRRLSRSSAGDRLRVGGRTFRVERAARADVSAVVALLADDEIGGLREDPELAGYEAAFDVVALDTSQYLAVVRDEGGHVVATMQLTIIPGLVRAGTTRLQIEGLRVAARHRSGGLGAAMLEWAHEHGRARGASLAQVTTDEARERARVFYERLGYEPSHVGLKRQL